MYLMRRGAWDAAFGPLPRAWRDHQNLMKCLR